MKKPHASPASFNQSGPAAVGKAMPMSKPQSPGGGGFLINANAFSDAHPPGAKGQRKSAGYPNFPRTQPK